MAWCRSVATRSLRDVDIHILPDTLNADLPDSQDGTGMVETLQHRQHASAGPVAWIDEATERFRRVLEQNADLQFGELGLFVEMRAGIPQFSDYVRKREILRP